MVIKLFGYRIHITKDPAAPSRNIPGGCKVTYYENYMYLTDPHGEILPQQVDITIQSEVNKPMRAIVTFFLDGYTEHGAKARFYPLKRPNPEKEAFDAGFKRGLQEGTPGPWTPPNNPTFPITPTPVLWKGNPIEVKTTEWQVEQPGEGKPS